MRRISLSRSLERRLAVVTIVCAVPMLSAFACSNDKVALRPDLPQMPATLQEHCKHPLINETDARGIIARYAVALNKCDGKRADAVAFHDSLRKGLK